MSRRVVAWVAAAVFGLTSVAVAQTSQAVSDGAFFTRYVPASARCFVSINSLDTWDESLPQLGLSAVFTLAGEGGTESRLRGDWRAALAHTIGNTPSLDLSLLATLHAGVAADSCRNLSRAVWFFRIPEPTMLDTWFPNSVRKAQKQSERATMFRTSDGLIVALADHVLLLSRRWVGDALLVGAIQMMAGKTLPSLHESKPYQDLATYLPDHALGTIFLVPGREGRTSSGSSTLLIPVFDRVIAGIYDAGDRMDVAIRGRLHDELVQSPAAADIIGQLFRLPRSTLLAVVGTSVIDLDAIGSTDGLELSRYAKLLMTLRGARADSHEKLPTIGPHVMLVWGQDLEAPSDFPQVTLLAQCEDAAMVKSELDGLLTSVLSAIRTLGADVPPHTLSIRHDAHLGVGISYIPPLSPELADRLGGLGLLAEVDLAWAAWGDWIAVSTHRAHLKGILDAQFGLAPTVGSLPDALNVWRGDRSASSVAIMRGHAASRQIESWLADRSSSTPLWLDPLWWGAVLSGDLFQNTSLGLRLGSPTHRGELTIASVEPGGSAAGRLLPGDDILGVNGRLLALTDTGRDFRRLWQQRAEDRAPVLRILRAGEPMDIELPLVPRDKAQALQFDPSSSLRMIGEALRGVGFVSFTTQPADAHHYAALLTLDRWRGHATP